MSIDYILPTSIVFGLAAWALAIRWYVDPIAREHGPGGVIRALLLLHTFRYIGLMFLIPGVTAEPLDHRFAAPAAYGDLLAAGLAFAALAALRFHTRRARLYIWIFNVWGTADLLNAVARGIMYTPDGHLGAAFWIPSVIVPMLLVTHVYIFVLLMGRTEGGHCDHSCPGG